MGYDFSRMTCLLVEDNKFMRSVMRICMDSLGVQSYYFAQDGREAIDILKIRAGTLKEAGAGGIDLVLSDVVMPGIDGHMLLRWIRRHESSSDRFVPVIMISGRQDMDQIVACIEAGADDYLLKPFNPVLLQARISAGFERMRWFDREDQYREQLER